MRRNDPNAGIARSVVASLVFILPAEAREDGTVARTDCGALEFFPHERSPRQRRIALRSGQGLVRYFDNPAATRSLTG